MKQKKVQGDPGSGLGQDEEESEEVALPRIDDLIEAATAVTKPKAPGFVCPVCQNRDRYSCPWVNHWGLPGNPPGFDPVK